MRQKTEVPQAVETVLKPTCMDGSIDSMETEEAINFYQELTKLSGSAGMYARKCISTKVLEQIPVEDRASKVNIYVEHLPNMKTLGIQWLRNEDIFSFTIAPQQ